MYRSGLNFQLEQVSTLSSGLSLTYSSLIPTLERRKKVFYFIYNCLTYFTRLRTVSWKDSNGSVMDIWHRYFKKDIGYTRGHLFLFFPPLDLFSFLFFSCFRYIFPFFFFVPWVHKHSVTKIRPPWATAIGSGLYVVHGRWYHLLYLESRWLLPLIAAVHET